MNIKIGHYYYKGEKVISNIVEILSIVRLESGGLNVLYESNNVYNDCTASEIKSCGLFQNVYSNVDLKGYSNIGYRPLLSCEDTFTPAYKVVRAGELARKMYPKPLKVDGGYLYVRF